MGCNNPASVFVRFCSNISVYVHVLLTVCFCWFLFAKSLRGIEVFWNNICSGVFYMPFVTCFCFGFSTNFCLCWWVIRLGRQRTCQIHSAALSNGTIFNLVSEYQVWSTRINTGEILDAGARAKLSHIAHGHSARSFCSIAAIACQATPQESNPDWNFSIDTKFSIVVPR